MARKLSTDEVFARMQKRSEEAKAERKQSSETSNVKTNHTSNNLNKSRSNYNSNKTPRKLSTEEVFGRMQKRNAEAKARRSGFSSTVANNATVGDSPSYTTSLARINSELSMFQTELSTKEAKYTDDYWEKRVDEENARFEREEEEFFQKNGWYRTEINGGGWGAVDAEKEAWEKERADLRKKIMDLTSMKKVYEGMSVTSAPDFNEYSAKGAKIKEEAEKPKVVYVPTHTDAASIRRKQGLTITGYTHWVTGEPLFMNSTGQIVTEQGVYVPEHLRDGGE